jgi:hypothetical protein
LLKIAGPTRGSIKLTAGLSGPAGVGAVSLAMTAASTASTTGAALVVQVFLGLHIDMRRREHTEACGVTAHFDKRHDNVRPKVPGLTDGQLVADVEGCAVVRPTEHPAARDKPHALGIDVGWRHAYVLPDQNPLIDVT